MKKIFWSVLLLIGAGAQAQLAEGKKNIEKLCGCFDVSFKYAETFSPDPAYKFHDRESLGGLELALPIEKTDKKIVIQHLLVVGDSMIVKHWREDWEFESPYLWKYEGDKKWVKEQLKPEAYQNKWTQTVWEVDDAPRYQGISGWVATDGKTFWQNTTNAPLPRREYTVRQDYNILRRGNRLIINDKGWTHEQDNDKVSSKDGSEKLIAQEKGYNIYTRVPDQQCAYAKVWWDEHSAFWKEVRTAWQSLIKEGHTISLQSKVDNRYLYQYLEDLSDQFNSKKLTPDTVAVQVKTTLQKFALLNKDVARK